MNEPAGNPGASELPLARMRASKSSLAPFQVIDVSAVSSVHYSRKSCRTPKLRSARSPGGPVALAGVETQDTS
jgi:hypothetical protein